MKIDGFKSVVVVGAGSAGWMAALFINKTFPDVNVTVIGSRELGILGAGEGTVPSIQEFLKFIEIHPHELLKKCKSTAKIGIKFVNWNGDGDYYHHGFLNSNIKRRKTTQKSFEDIPFEHNFFEFNNYVNGDYINDYDYESLCANLLRMPIPKDKLHMYDFSLNSWHFDAVEITKFFEEVGTSRGIKYIDDYVTSFNQDKEGYITQINMKNGTIDCDFVFDCSGFKRLIIDKLYHSRWVDVSDKLTVNRALPFFLPPDKLLKNYTTATAMDSGWVWEIPLQHRSGCGYVFNSDFCDDETAKKELIEKYGNNIDIPKSFSFTAGYYKEIWIKNCIAIGLSSGFFEPMEATSIWGSIYELSILNYGAMFFPKAPQSIINNFNMRMNNFNDGIAAFLQFHYMSNRRDTEFWRDITSKTYFETHKDFFNTIKFSPPNAADKSILPFSLKSYCKVGRGICFFDKESIKQKLNIYKDYFIEFDDLSKKTMKLRIKSDVERNISHQEFLEMVVGKEKLEENRRLIFK